MKFSPIVLAGAVLTLASPALAHHSGAMFDRSKTISITGVLKDYQFVNPHSWIDVVVAGDDGKTTLWAVEAQTPSYMRRLGVTPSVMNPGDKVVVRAHPLRDGRSGGSFVDISLPDGRVLGAQATINYGAPGSAAH